MYIRAGTLLSSGYISRLAGHHHFSETDVSLESDLGPKFNEYTYTVHEGDIEIDCFISHIFSEDLISFFITCYCNREHSQ